MHQIDKANARRKTTTLFIYFLNLYKSKNTHERGSKEMSFFEKWEAAIGNKDLDE